MALINCPKCGKEISDRGEICPYCRMWLKENYSEQQSQNPTSPDISSKDKNKTQKTNNLVTGIVAILLIIGIIFLISQCVKDDGSCERCNKEGIYEIGGDKYCKKHYLDVLGELITWDGD